MEARVDHTWTRVQPKVTCLILACIALSAVRSSEERLIQGFVFLPCGSRGDLEHSNVPLGQSSPAGPAAGAQTPPGSQFRDGQETRSFKPPMFRWLYNKCGK